MKKREYLYIYIINKTVFIQFNFIYILYYGENITLGTYRYIKKCLL